MAVPSHVLEEVFWVRYFFRVHQIEQEESRRKAFLHGNDYVSSLFLPSSNKCLATTDKEEDFSWEDDEGESTSPTAAGASQSSMQTLASSQRTLAPRRTALTDECSSSLPVSPRLSSEDSFDVVSGNVSNAGDVAEVPTKASEDEDSDWE